MKKRPINLNLFVIYFPITAIISILHRLSGVFLFLMIPILLFCLQSSLEATASREWDSILNGHLGKGLIWLTLSALFYHLIAGLRHLIMDIGWGESLWVARISAKTILLLGIVYSILLGGWLWY
ncbi:MAG: succinate dehydrogenase cytochrome b556 subunit [Pseudomonadota bacterium]